MYTILKEILDDYGSNTVNINIDTLYLKWNFTFPAVSLCFHKGRSTTQIKNVLEKYWTDNNITLPQTFELEKKEPFLNSTNFNLFPSFRFRKINIFKMAQSYLFVHPNQFIEPNDEYCDTQNLTCGLNVSLQDKVGATVLTKKYKILFITSFCSFCPLLVPSSSTM
jgi:hypothetical protein